MYVLEQVYSHFSQNHQGGYGMPILKIHNLHLYSILVQSETMGSTCFLRHLLSHVSQDDL